MAPHCMCFAMADSPEQVARDADHSRKHVANLLRAGHYEFCGSFVTLATAAQVVWNMEIAFVAGNCVYAPSKGGWL